MAIQLQHSDLEDPFADLPLHSLFPHSLGPAAAPNSEPFQILFQSMAIKGSTKVLEDARAISESYSSNQDSHIQAEDNATNCNRDHLQGRRPALGRKKARFCLKPTTSDSSAKTAIYDIVEPQEFFSAVDQMQKAEEELKKCRNTAAPGLEQLHPSPVVRNRRVGILGRTASYKHHLSDNADNSPTTKTLMSLEDIPCQSPAKTSITSESSHMLHQETPGKDVSHSIGVTNELFNGLGGFTSEKEKSVDDLLEKMFTSFKDFNGDNGLKLLQEKLQTKSRVLGKSTITEFDAFQRSNHRKLRSTTQKGSDSSRHPEHLSSIISKSPLAVLAKLQRRISLKDPVVDPYDMPLSSDEPYSGKNMHHRTESSSSSDISNGVTNGVAADDAFTPESISGKRATLIEKPHVLAHDVEGAFGNKITSEEDSVEHAGINGVNSNRFSTLENDVAAGNDGYSEKEANELLTNTSESAHLDTVVKDLTLDFMHQTYTEVMASPPSMSMEINTDVSSLAADASVQNEVNIAKEEKTVSHVKESKGIKTTDTSHSNSRRKSSRNVNSSGNGGRRSSGRGTILQDKVNVMVQGEATSKATISTDTTHGVTNEISAADAFTPVIANVEKMSFVEEPRLPSHDGNITSGTTTTSQEDSVDHAWQNGVESNNFNLENDVAAGNEGFAGKEAHMFEECSNLSPVRTLKRKAPSGKNRKITANRQSICRRQSLADGGLAWQSGVRRSTRIKSRPLQHWCGEKMLYGRIHESVISVIGMKLASPTDNGKSPMLKVKSYVPDKYADLVSKVSF